MYKVYILSSGVGFMLTFAMRCNLGVTLTELTKPKNVTVARKIGSVTDDIETSLVNGSQI